MQFTTLNNHVCSGIIQNALKQNYRYCIYSLYNYHKAGMFSTPLLYKILGIVYDILEEPDLMFKDDSIDYSVRYFAYRYLTIIRTMKGGVTYD